VVKPVLVLQNLDGDGPAYLATWLRRAGVAFEVFNTQAGQAYPESIAGYRALALLGGEMSANDPLPSLRAAEHLIRQAIAANVPTLGHCLGGQLMARALGATVGRSPATEIGWHAIERAPVAAAQDWFGAEPRQRVFQWHDESFALPHGAELLAGSAGCPHQAFAVGPHLAMQFHVELDATKLALWSASTDPRFLAMTGVESCVQDGATMRREAAQALPAQQRLADRIYARWLGAAG